MPATTVPDRAVTFDEFCALLPDYQKADLIDGVVYFALADTRLANLTAGLLMSLMRMYDSAKGLDGAVFGGRFAFQLGQHDGLEPDVAYVTKRRLHFLEEFRMNGGPDVAVEIISPESEYRDRVLKRDSTRKPASANTGSLMPTSARRCSCGSETTASTMPCVSRRDASFAVA